MNATTGKPAAGDSVILLPVVRGENEVTTQTDQRGEFMFAGFAPGSRHIARVIHGGIGYDYALDAKGWLQASVFETARDVAGVIGHITIIQVESIRDGLRIKELHAISNESSPPMTQVRPDNLEIFVPEGARMEEVRAYSQSGQGTEIEPIHKGGGRYEISFPLKPGLTRFIVTYGLPGRSSAVFSIKSHYPTRQFSVMFPQTMKFSSRNAFHRIVEQQGFQVEAINQMRAEELARFEIVGAGTLPARVLPPGAAPQTTRISSSNSNTGRNSGKPAPVRSGVMEGSIALAIAGVGILLAWAIGRLILIRKHRTS